MAVYSNHVYTHISLSQNSHPALISHYFFIILSLCSHIHNSNPRISLPPPQKRRQKSPRPPPPSHRSPRLRYRRLPLRARHPPRRHGPPPALQQTPRPVGAHRRLRRLLRHVARALCARRLVLLAEAAMAGARWLLLQRRSGVVFQLGRLAVALLFHVCTATPLAQSVMLPAYRVGALLSRKIS